MPVTEKYRLSFPDSLYMLQDNQVYICRWLGLVPQQAVCLRSDVGPTCGVKNDLLKCYHQDISSASTFPVLLIQRMYPADGANTVQTMRVVGGNPYFGFRRGFSEVCATQYRPLAAFCGQLLIAMGDKSFEN